LPVLTWHVEPEGKALLVDENSLFEKFTKDYALTEYGKLQAKIASECICGKYGDFDISYTLRAKQTMEILLSRSQCCFEDPRLRGAERGL